MNLPAGEQGPQPAPAHRKCVVVVFEVLDHWSGVRLQSRKQAFFLVGMMVGRGAVKIFDDGAGGGARFVVATVLRKVALEPAERRELALDAAVARDEHPERIVESGRG